MIRSGSSCIVTGCASGIGAELCKLLDEQGHNVIGIDMFPSEYTSIEMDLVKAYYDNELLYIGVFGYLNKHNINTVDLIVNCAGIGKQQEVVPRRYTIEKSSFIRLNYLVPMWFCDHFVRRFRMNNSHGHIVNISSGQAFFKLPTWGEYTASKAALGAASEALSYEVECDNICVTTVYPFMVNTSFYDKTKEEANTLGSRLAMKLLPYYSYSPKYVAKQILKAVDKHKRIEMCSPINYLPSILPMRLVRKLATKVLMK